MKKVPDRVRSKGMTTMPFRFLRNYSDQILGKYVQSKKFSLEFQQAANKAPGKVWSCISTYLQIKQDVQNIVDFVTAIIESDSAKQQNQATRSPENGHRRSIGGRIPADKNRQSQMFIIFG